MRKDLGFVGLDLVKRVFQFHARSAEGSITICRKLQRGEVRALFSFKLPSLVGMDACASAHHWARELQKLVHEEKFIPAYVKPYVTRAGSPGWRRVSSAKPFALRLSDCQTRSRW